jgi:hypothetical protein
LQGTNALAYFASSSVKKKTVYDADTKSVPGSQKIAILEGAAVESQKNPRPEFRQNALIDLDSCKKGSS